MKEFGVHLKDAREAAGLSIKDIHESTRISIKNLRLIESGDFPSIPQTYVRAFVREYARAVELDEDDTLAYYNDAAEREKGIPRPPENIDSSNLHIKVDDTIEYIEPLARPTSHVEVEGTAEVAPDDYVPPVRKSRYVDKDSGTPIDIRTTAATPPAKKEEALAPPERKSAAKEQAAKEDERAPKGVRQGPHRKETARGDVGASGSAASADTPFRKSAESGTDKSPTTGESAKPPAAEKKTQPPPADSPPPPQGKTPPPPQGKTPPPPQGKTPPPPQGKKAMPKPSEEDPSLEGGMPPAPAAAPPAHVPPGIPPDSANEKRIIGIGLVIITIIVIAVYGMFYFSGNDDADTARVDSTAIKASIEAGRFIDSSQYALTEIEIPAEDTIPAEALTPPEPVESKPRVFERSDSLVLEAFTSAPVWFSVKMDTLRTERGSLSSKEHRVWKARDYFVITLGDAGAVTFFLNGEEIGTLGEEGAVVKNVTLSRRQLEGN